MSDHHVAIVRRFFDEVWNQRHDAVIDELLTDESICHTDDGVIVGRDGFRQMQYIPLTSAYPDIHVNIDAAISQDDIVAVRWTARGTHTGDGLGFAATQHVSSFQGISWIRVAHGKFVEGWQSSNITNVIGSLAAGLTK
jgi:predicted ester cyclase